MRGPGGQPPLDDLDDLPDTPPARVRRPRAAPLERQERPARASREDVYIPDEADEADAPEPENTGYRRRSKPVQVRRSGWADFVRFWRRGWKPILTLAAVAIMAGSLYALLFRSSWFVLAGSSQIALAGNAITPAATLDAVFAPDLGRNIFFIPLEARRVTLEQIPWVKSAEVRRLWPAQLEVRIGERTPIAFARAGNALLLIDAAGVALDRPAAGNFDFPVVDGLTGADSATPNAPEIVAQRREQLKAYTALRDDLDKAGAHASADLSEIDVSHPENLAARVPVPGSPDTMLVKFGNQDYGARYQMYLGHIAQWRQQYPQLVAVDLHVDGEVAMENAPPPAPVKEAKPGTKPAAVKPPTVAPPGRGGGH